MPGQKWTRDEIAFVADNAASLSSAEIAHHLKRSRRSVQDKARLSGVKFLVKRCRDGTTRRKWVRSEVIVLMGLAENHTLRQAAARMQRSYSSVANKADELRISFKDQRLQLKDVAEIIGVSSRCIADRRNKLGLMFRTGRHNKNSGRHGMKGAVGSDIVAIAQDLLNDPPGHNFTLTAKHLREVVAEYADWE